MNGIDHFDIDRFKQEIMTEIRKEINKMKIDIIEGMYIFVILIIIKTKLFKYSQFYESN
jgi:hypothetical protein